MLLTRTRTVDAPHRHHLLRCDPARRAGVGEQDGGAIRGQHDPDVGVPCAREHLDDVRPDHGRRLWLRHEGLEGGVVHAQQGPARVSGAFRQ